MISYSQKHGEFYQDLQTQVNSYFRENNLSKKGNWRGLTQYLVTFSTLIISWIVLFLIKPHLWISIWFWALMGLCIAMLCIIGHEAVHNCLSANPKLNNLVKTTINLLGGNWQHYRFKHSIHHAYTNVLGVDDDINFWPVIRTNQNDKFYFWHRFQHLYIPILYCFAAIFLVFDFGFLSDKPVAEFKPIKPTKTDLWLFWLAKIFHLVIFFLIPGFAVGFGWVIGGYLLMMAIAGLYLSLLIQPTHLFTGTTFWEGQDKPIETEWAKVIAGSTANYGTDNRLLTYLSGGMNFHLVHSLFPSISSVHYRQLHPIVVSVCQKHEVNYHEFASTRMVIDSHFRHLKAMSKIVRKSL